MPEDILSAAHYSERNFDRSVMSGKSITGSEFVATTFHRCRFVEAVLEDCVFANCKFDNCDLTMTHVSGSRFSSVVFKDTRVVGIDWTRAAWPLPEGRKQISFSHCVLNHSTFIGLKLREIEFVDCVATDVDFRESDLTGASFADTDLAQSLFLKTDLTQADFSRARNYSIDPLRNKILRAKFSLPEALSLLYNMGVEMIDEFPEPDRPK